MILFSCRVFLLFCLSFGAFADQPESLGWFKTFAPWINAETLLDNTSNATAKTSIPGWVNSSEKVPEAFGITFKTGPSEYVLRSVTMMVASAIDAPGFDGTLKVSLYAVPEDNFPPGNEALSEVSNSKVKITPSEAYQTINLDFPILQPNTWYAIAFSAPSAAIARIMGYQIPNVAPTPSMGFESGTPFYGQPRAWQRLLNPYIWLQGWDVKSDAFVSIKRKVGYSLLGGIGLLLGALLLFGISRRTKR